MWPGSFKCKYTRLPRAMFIPSHQTARSKVYITGMPDQWVLPLLALVLAGMPNRQTLLSSLLGLNMHLQQLSWKKKKTLKALTKHFNPPKPSTSFLVRWIWCLKTELGLETKCRARTSILVILEGVFQLRIVQQTNYQVSNYPTNYTLPGQK